MTLKAVKTLDQHDSHPTSISSSAAPASTSLLPIHTFCFLFYFLNDFPVERVEHTFDIDTREMKAHGL